MKSDLMIGLAALFFTLLLAACASNDLANNAHGSAAHMKSCGTGHPCQVCCSHNY